MEEISIKKGVYEVCDERGHPRMYLPHGQIDFVPMQVRFDRDYILKRIEENE